MSTEAAADIQSVDASAALQLPGVVGYIDKKVGLCCCAKQLKLHLHSESSAAIGLIGGLHSTWAACVWSYT